MTQIYAIVHDITTIRGTVYTQTVNVAAHDVCEAQEKFIDYYESKGFVHGEILSIRPIASVAN